MRKDEFNRYLASSGIIKVLGLLAIIAGILFIIHGFVDSNAPFWMAIVLIAAFILLWTTSLIAFRQKKDE